MRLQVHHQFMLLAKVYNATLPKKFSAWASVVEAHFPAEFHIQPGGEIEAFPPECTHSTV